MKQMFLRKIKRDLPWEIRAQVQVTRPIFTENKPIIRKTEEKGLDFLHLIDPLLLNLLKGALGSQTGKVPASIGRIQIRELSFSTEL
jgi:hypothetical protein